jgi:hypothetical protein
LVLLLGLSTGVENLEGELSGCLDQSSQVHTVFDFFPQQSRPDC